MNQIMNGVVVILTAIIGVAILSVLVSRNSNTAGVLSAGASAFSNALGTAMSPVTGSSAFGSIGSGYSLGMGQLA